MGAGRPTKYTEELLEKAYDYLENWRSYGDAIPMACGLADHLGIHRDTMYEWCKHEDKCQFSDIVKTVATKQERVLINGLLSGEMNPQTGNKILSARHDYKDTSQIDNISSDGSMSTGKPTKIELVAYEANSDD